MLEETPLDIPEHTTITPNGALYRTDKKGFLPEMMQEIYDDRTIFKKKMLNRNKTTKIRKTQSIKSSSVITTTFRQERLHLNSAYGAIGNQYFRYYDLAIAEGSYLWWTVVHSLD